MRTFLLATASLITLSIAAPAAFSATDQDAAYDKGNHPVGDTNGHCVRTKWNAGEDPCAVTPPPPPPVVVARPAPVKAAPLPIVSKEASTVYFDFNKSTLKGDDTAKLDKLADIINGSTAIHDVAIHGYTDQLGSDSYNKALADKRVDAVKAYLATKISKPLSGDVRGIGKATPQADCKKIKKRAEKIACMAEDRRVEVEFKAEKPGTN